MLNRLKSSAGLRSAEVQTNGSRSEVGDDNGETYVRPPEFDMDFVNKEDIEVFRKALSVTEPEPSIYPLTPRERRVQHISAVSDFAPINQKVSKKRSKMQRDVVREGWAYPIARWPLIFFIGLFVVLQFFSYILVRQLVNIIEYFSAWRGYRGLLRLRLRKAPTYDKWKECALDLDRHLGLEEWKKSDENSYYDWSLLRKIFENLRELRERGDYDGVRSVLEICLRSNFAGTESFRLYAETHLGSKNLLERYVDEVEKSVTFIRNAPTDRMSTEEKASFFKYASKNYGRTALCLSGGASFGYYHFGVLRAMLDAGLLPQVISGTSAGGLVAAFACCYKEDELKRLLIPEVAEKITACSDSFKVWYARYRKTGARFDPVEWAEKCSFWTHGNTTFKEAFERTGKILNISVVPADPHSPTKLLNYLTSPNVIIATAAIASAAVPGILPPVVLLEKDRNGKARPYEFHSKHRDGSLRVDIPLKSLHLLYNVNYSIVSQVNPHVHLFFFQPRGSAGKPVAHRKGKGWRGGFFLSAAEQLLKIEIAKNFRIIRDLELLPEVGGMDLAAAFLQKFEGTVTLTPKSRLWDWVRILDDPDPKELARMIDVGQRATWPKLHMIENRMRIEKQIELGRTENRRGKSLVHDRILPNIDGANGSGSELDPLRAMSAVESTTTPESDEKAGEKENGNKKRKNPFSPKSLRRQKALSRLGMRRTSDHMINIEAGGEARLGEGGTKFPDILSETEAEDGRSEQRSGNAR
ncbi:patatin-domain-containing protein [Atractiella rhizophila]|nr:patatin-domain-containing protein [Atractiella rhizophila]